MRRLISMFPGLLWLLVAAPLAAETDPWYPYPIEVRPSLLQQEQPYLLRLDYIPQPQAERVWKLCVAIPHLKDVYWLAVNHGLVAEARRLGVDMDVLVAGGYEYLDRQIQQVRNCVDNGGEVAIIAAIEAGGMNRLVVELRTAGVPVIDLINGITSPLITARTMVSFTEMAREVGDYIVRLHPRGTELVQVAWFPGPEGAGFVAAAEAGFREAMARGATEVISTSHGDLVPEAQGRLVAAALDAHPDIRYIVANAVAAEVAVDLLRERDLEGQVTVLAYYFTPALLSGLRNGNIAMATSDSPVVLGRIVVDQAVRILEEEPFIANLGPRLLRIGRANLDTFKREAVLAPEDFEAVLQVRGSRPTGPPAGTVPTTTDQDASRG